MAENPYAFDPDTEEARLRSAGAAPDRVDPREVATEVRAAWRFVAYVLAPLALAAFITLAMRGGV